MYLDNLQVSIYTRIAMKKIVTLHGKTKVITCAQHASML